MKILILLITRELPIIYENNSGRLRTMHQVLITRMVSYRFHGLPQGAVQDLCKTIKGGRLEAC